MQMLGIDCMVVHDSHLSHSWDLVKLDGQWYHTDIYSDAGSGEGNFSHFTLNEEMMNSQEWNTDFFPAMSTTMLTSTERSARMFTLFPSRCVRRSMRGRAL